MRGPFGGEGFIADLAFAVNHPDPSSVKAGLSPELDALAAYVASLSTASVPRSPHRQTDGAMTASALAGAIHFNDLNCLDCHGGSRRTNSPVTNVTTNLLPDVGTLSGFSGQRLGSGTLGGVDTPTLLGLYENRTFLHHGQAESLSDALTYAGGELYSIADATFLHAEPGNQTSVDRITVRTKAAYEGGGGSWVSPMGVFSGQHVQIQADTLTFQNGLRFSNIDGGVGGSGLLHLRASYGRWGQDDLVVVVNGLETRHETLRTRVAVRYGGAQWMTVPVTLTAGATNTIELLRPTDVGNRSLYIESMIVVTPDDLTAAEAHRVVETLTPAEQDELIAYLLQLDGRETDGSLPVPAVAGVSVRLPPVADRGRFQGNGSEATHATDATDHFALKFPLPDGPLYAATLRVYRPSGDATSTQVHAFTATDDWREGIGSFPAAGVDLGGQSAATDGVWLEWDVTAFVHAEMATNSVASFVLSSQALATLATRENATHPPELVLTLGEPVQVQWLVDHFGAAFAENALAAWGADADADELDNLSEYLLGYDPQEPTTTSPYETVRAGDAIIFRFRLRATRGTAEMRLVQSNDLNGWTPATSAQWTLAETVAGFEHWEVALPLQAATHQFYRLQLQP